MAPSLEIRDVRLSYRLRRGLLAPKRTIPAVRGVSLRLARGATLGLVGESGCGKSTLARIMLGLARPDSGDVLYDGKPLGDNRREIARHVQIVFQDPYSSLNPSRTIADIIRLPLQAQGVPTAEQVRRTQDAMASVGLERRLAHSYPHQLSGGQRQRVAIARALVGRPQVVICDEPTSALDVSVQAQILNLLMKLQHEFGVSFILISHNLAVVRHMADRVAVMYLGRIVEEQETARLFDGPLHPYTRLLLSSMLELKPGRRFDGAVAQGEAADWTDDEGCSYRARCPIAIGACATHPPPLVGDETRRVECHLAQPSQLAESR